MYQAVEYLWGKSPSVCRPPFLRRMAFQSVSEREAWVREGSPFVNAPGHREPLDDGYRAES